MAFRQWIERDGKYITLWMRTAAGTNFRHSVLLDSAFGDVFVELESVLARANHLPGVPQSPVWQPIETAPRAIDKPILAWNSRQPTWPPVVVRWDERECIDDEPHWSDAATRDGDALYYNQNFFDLWQPLPAYSVSRPHQPGGE